MSKLRALLAMSFRAKVLVPVIIVMVALLAITAWVVNQRITDQVKSDAIHTLAVADEGFRMLQKDQTDNLLLRFHELPKQPYYKAAFYTRDGPTLREPLKDLLAQQSVDIVLFHASKLIASAARDPLTSVTAFESASALAIRGAMQRQETPDTLRVGDRVYNVVSIPVLDPNNNLGGVLTVGSEMRAEDAKKLGDLTHSEIILIVNDQVISARFSAPETKTQFIDAYKELSREASKTNGALVVKEMELAGEHYFCSAGQFTSLSGENAFGYLVLYSSEQPRRALQTTQQILVTVNSLAIILGVAIVCLVIGKVTRPLRELRDSAEAVGRGDFSRRVEVKYEDECGELARVFNQMTENLKNSREQLELTVETLKTTQAQLVQSEKLSGLGEFIAGVAHELNNPLTSVMGFSELLQQADADPKHKRYLDMIHKSALRCQKIVQALLSFARRRTPERKPACVNGLIEAAVEILQYQLRTSNIEVVTRLDPHLPQAMVDPHQIQQVFVNIINNARQAIESHQPKGCIRITSVKQGDSVRVIIQDNGPGITTENLSKIFDPFFTTKDVGKGTGLGLSLCYGIIKEHGGTITPCSKPGEGTVFIIELPITHEAVDTTEEAHFDSSDTTNIREGHGKRILVIDDEEPILHMVREALIPSGYEVDIAPDGETGLKQSKKKKYDVMLCDWKMPGLNGQEVYEKLRVINPTLSERTIFITGDTITEKTRKFLEQQNKICLPKPFRLAEFRAAIKKVIADGTSQLPETNERKPAAEVKERKAAAGARERKAKDSAA
jgi:signal transduction histidine kinase/DNA-binding NarL/FixJ family response regulator